MPLFPLFLVWVWSPFKSNHGTHGWCVPPRKNILLIISHNKTFNPYLSVFSFSLSLSYVFCYLAIRTWTENFFGLKPTIHPIFAISAVLISWNFLSPTPLHFLGVGKKRPNPLTPIFSFFFYSHILEDTKISSLIM